MDSTWILTLSPRTGSNKCLDHRRTQTRGRRGTASTRESEAAGTEVQVPKPQYPRAWGVWAVGPGPARMGGVRWGSLCTPGCDEQVFFQSQDWVDSGSGGEKKDVPVWTSGEDWRSESGTGLPACRSPLGGACGTCQKLLAQQAFEWRPQACEWHPAQVPLDPRRSSVPRSPPPCFLLQYPNNGLQEQRLSRRGTVPCKPQTAGCLAHLSPLLLLGAQAWKRAPFSS